MIVELRNIYCNEHSLKIKDLEFLLLRVIAYILVLAVTLIEHQMTQEELKLSEDVLNSYKEKCSILKQVHSNKKGTYDAWTTFFNVSTIIASLILTTVGFINKDVLYELFMSGTNKDKSLKFFDFAFNSAVLIVLILSILNLIYRVQDKSFEHNRSVILLSNMLRDIQETKSLAFLPSTSYSNIQEKISQLSFRYSNIIDTIPLHSDKDFLKAKEDYYKKKKKSKEIDEKYQNESKV